jgi:hypothetical protein
VFCATSIRFVSSPSIGSRLCPCLMTERSFICHPRIAQRDAGRLKWQEKRAAERGERVVETQERQKALRERDRATMDAFMKMAKEKFG